MSPPFSESKNKPRIKHGVISQLAELFITTALRTQIMLMFRSQDGGDSMWVTAVLREVFPEVLHTLIQGVCTPWGSEHTATVCFYPLRYWTHWYRVFALPEILNTLLQCVSTAWGSGHTDTGCFYSLRFWIHCYSVFLLPEVLDTPIQGVCTPWNSGLSDTGCLYSLRFWTHWYRVFVLLEVQNTVIQDVCFKL
jgi:hypothetical protein